MCLSENNCCCCFTLNIGTKIISIVCTIIALVATVVYGAAAALEPRPPAPRLVFYGAMAAVALLQLLCGCLLIYGAHSRSPGFLWPWAVVSWCKAAWLVALTVAGTVLVRYNARHETTAEITTVIAVYFIYALILFYFASVVNSRRQQMVVEARTKRLIRHRVLPNYYV